jgi:hypothetical protein
VRRGSRKGEPAATATGAAIEKEANMPLAKIHVLEGRYDEVRLAKVSEAIQNSLIEGLGIPPDDFFQIHHVLPRNRYLHTPAFLGQKYSDDMILLELTSSSHQRTPAGSLGRISNTQFSFRNGCNASGSLIPPC